MRKTFQLFVILLGLSQQLRAEDWMARLPDNVYVATLSIPGAHDACTGCGWASGMESLGDLFARTQDIDLAAEWSIGIRAFDLRPCVYESHMNINHGIMPTQMHFEDALALLRDSLHEHPSEFVVIHLLHETDGDQVENAYNSRLLELLGRDDLKDLFVDFKTNLIVGDLRGRILLLSRDNYATSPVGGFFLNWTGEANWSRQTQGRIRGRSTNGRLYMQDFADTHNAGGLDTKVSSICQLLDFSTTHEVKQTSTITWVFNFASAYSLTQNLFGNEVSLSDGYRDNAAHTHAAILDYLATHDPGPTGIVMMDFVGVDESAGYAVRGQELVDAIIQNNFRYITAAGIGAPQQTVDALGQVYDLLGRRQSPSSRCGLTIVPDGQGHAVKTLRPAQ